MPIDLPILCRRIDPKHTVLLFGAGSSIPSGAPSGADLSMRLLDKFGLAASNLALIDAATIIEARFGRRPMIEALQAIVAPVSPMQGILNLPDFDWASIFTTNYDEVIEKAYKKRGKDIYSVSSNYDLKIGFDQGTQVLYKIHGTIGSDVCFGHQHRMVVTAQDYDTTSDHREYLYVKFAEQLYSKNAIIIGYSLSDPDLRTIIDEAVRIKKSRGAPGKITVFIYQKDDNQALIYEARGFDVCFGGIDAFFAELVKHAAPTRLVMDASDDPLDRVRALLPSTVVVSSRRQNEAGALSKMFNGSPATYADIMRGWTFERDFSDKLEAQLAGDGASVAYVLGPAGCGKTTGVRKVLNQLVDRDVYCWEHLKDLPLSASSWVEMDAVLRERVERGVLFVDDAHENLHAVNQLVDEITRQGIPALRVVLVSSKPQWNPRLKSAAIFKYGQMYEVGALSPREIDSLLDVLEQSRDVSSLVESRFTGFNREERRRRLTERCGSDMFVCMKNIFAFDAFDDIILREYASLDTDYQEVYRRISGMEAAGVRVHRQLVIRTVGIQAAQVARYLGDLEGLIEEYTVNERNGIFGWKVRHSVIADIISRYKLSDPDEYYRLLENTIDNLNPAYSIEIMSMNEICDMRKGMGRVFDREKQNILLRKMISKAPRERVPRHRLITNLIKMNEFDAANTEIRIFENELRIDGPVQRYKVQLRVERAKHAKGVLDEDRLAMVREAASLAEAGIERFSDDKNLYSVYLEAGVAYYRYAGSREVFDRAIQAAKSAYDRILDPDLRQTIMKFERIEQRFASE